MILKNCNVALIPKSTGIVCIPFLPSPSTSFKSMKFAKSATGTNMKKLQNIGKFSYEPPPLSKPVTAHKKVFTPIKNLAKRTCFLNRNGLHE